MIQRLSTAPCTCTCNHRLIAHKQSCYHKLAPTCRLQSGSASAFFGRRLPDQVSKPFTRLHLRIGRKQVIRAAIFGVGAPEALLVGVVALVVFGPKGLAQAVKSLGATLKTFSPTIRELANVTNDLSSTLQEQIGLDDIRNEFRNPPPSYYRNSENTFSSDTPASTSTAQKEQKDIDTKEVESIPSEDLKAKIADSKRMAWGGQVPEASVSKAAEAAVEPEQAPPRKASDLSIDELEAELKRRREVVNKD